MSDNCIGGNSHIVAYGYPSICTAIGEKCHIVAYFRHTTVGGSTYAHTGIYAKVITYYGFGIYDYASIMEYLNTKSNRSLAKLKA